MLRIFIFTGATQRITAMGSFADNSTQTLQSVRWSSSADTVATITNDASNHGVAFGVAPGITTIQVCTGTICGSTVLTVAP
jgi:hypothetical protein